MTEATFHPSDDDQVAAFLARKGATVCAPGLAYGVNAEADKAKRLAERDRLWIAEATSENRAERLMESVREAYHVGGHRAAIEALNGEY